MRGQMPLLPPSNTPLHTMPLLFIFSFKVKYISEHFACNIGISYSLILFSTYLSINSAFKGGKGGNCPPAAVFVYIY